MKRTFIIVLDSCGAGQMPDADKFGDKDCNTLKRIHSSSCFSCENTGKLGIGNIEGLDFLGKAEKPLACVARMTEKSAGKDTTIGHWEIAGIVSEKPLPTYPEGFPKEILDKFSEKTGRGVLCNKPYSGTDVIRDYGEEHLESGKLIVYTSADSVFQIAANESIVPVEQLYDYCRIAREILVDEHGVGRVIARPFTGDKKDNFTRTANRHDFSLKPPKKTLLDAIKENGKTVWAVGKISDIFAGEGVTKTVFTHSNSEGMAEAINAVKTDFEGLCFINLVDFDMLYGHRQDINGYAAAYTEFDKFLPEFIGNMKKDDILIITADHGCDPGDESTDHTREYTPLLVYGENIKPINLGTRECFSDIAASVAEYLDVDFAGAGKSFLDEIIIGE